MSIKEVAFLEGRLFPVNQSSLKCFQTALINWKKPAFRKRQFAFGHSGL